MAAKRTIRGEQYNIAELVDGAIAAIDARLELNTDAARQSLMRQGHTNPADTLVNRYARETAILDVLQRQTGASFSNQIGKIGFEDRDNAITQVNSYLNRRNQGQRSRWGK